ncbi:MAG: rod shape-determining protein [Thermotogae bacterium]|nr:rod shape-determining protein [Thermotogota bacterium]
MSKNDIGIDLGTVNILIYQKKHGIVIQEPSVVAISKNTREILAIGNEARQMLGKTPGDIIALRPMKDGVIAEYRITEAVLKHLVRRIIKGTLIKPNVVVCVPARLTGVEKRAVIETTLNAGARRVYLISEPIAAAIGAGINIREPYGNIVIDIGGGTTDIAIISLGGIVVSDSIKTGGNRFDDAIIKYVKRKYKIIIGESTAENVKINIGKAYNVGEEKEMLIKGREMVSGLPYEVTVTSSEILEALQDSLEMLIVKIKGVLEKAPPELSADIIDKGIVLTGGSSLLEGMDELIRNSTGVDVIRVDEPLICVAKGAGLALEDPELLERVSMSYAS